MLFWQVFDGELVLNDIGRMMKEVIDQIPEHYPGINVEISVIIPIHIHILFLIADVWQASVPTQDVAVVEATHASPLPPHGKGILARHSRVASILIQKVK